MNNQTQKQQSQQNPNLAIYNQVRKVPDNALKDIGAGRLKGFSSINNMWRIKALTEVFGPCGLGWNYIIDKVDEKFYEQTGEVLLTVQIHLYVRFPGTDKLDGPIPGIGASKLLSQERSGPYLSDEALKGAVSDALGNAMKMLGVGADVYWGQDDSKYAYYPQEAYQYPQQQNSVQATAAQPQQAPVPAEPKVVQFSPSVVKGDVNASLGYTFQGGKYAGKTVAQVATEDRKYLEWYAHDYEPKSQAQQTVVDACQTALAYYQASGL